MSLQRKKGKASPEAPDPGSLRKHAWKRFLRGPDAELLEQLYIPALGEATRYDRCCAYFSSSVMAAAARGFGKLIARLMAMGKRAPRPAIRLVVNEELAAEDVRALVETGDLSELEKALKKRFRNPRELLEKRRLSMLGWLAKEGYLEVRVGVMRRGAGIMHAKFGIATDEGGDAVVFSGSGNESARGLTANYERLEVTTSWEDPDRYRVYQEEFAALWKNEDPFVHTVTLPEALRLKLVKFAPKEPPVEEPTEATKRQKAAMILEFIVEAPYLPDGAAACDSTGIVGLWPHQRQVVEEVAEAWPDGRLLCDEVGLGKTIETIFVLRRLIAGRGVRRALFLVPKNLLQQWQDELREKGGLLFPRLEGRETLVWPDGSKEKVNGFAEALSQNVLLVSREFARLESNLAVLLRAEAWDLVLLDEAHAARRRRQEEGEFNSATWLLTMLRELQLRRKTRGLLLLSATPMQTHPWEPWDLLAILGEGGEWLSEFSTVRDYYRTLSALKSGSCDINAAERAAWLITADPEFPAPGGNFPFPVAPEQIAQMLAFASPSEREELARWLRKGTPLARRMHRSTRDTLRSYYQMGLLEQGPPQRNVQDIVFDFQDKSERAVYDSVSDYIQRRFEVLESEQQGKGFVMTIYRRRASSSPLALERSLMRRKKGLERIARRYTYDAELSDRDAPEALELDDLPEADSTGVLAGFPEGPHAAREELSEVEKLLNEIRELGARDSKRDEFFDILRTVSEDGRPALVFTGYRDTLEYLREALLLQFGETVGCYSGSGGEVWDGERWKVVTKDVVTRALNQGELRVLICTDAASEGLNLQAAGALINYDLPWNPSRVEQRIGRIDRIGQRYPVVYVVNLFLKDSVDDRVYTLLRERCGLFEQFVGAMQPVLSRARRMLLGQEPLDLEGLEFAAAELTKDSLPSETYLSAAATKLKDDEAPVQKADLTAALKRADRQLNIRVRKAKSKDVIEVSGLGRRKLRFSASIAELEADPHVRPLSPFDEKLKGLVDRLARAGERLPLVVGSFGEGAFRASLAYWIGKRATRRISTLSELSELVESWEGRYPEPEEWQRTLRRARREARRLVTDLRARAGKREQFSFARQIEAARLRLLRELGRYLKCLRTGTDDLNQRLYQRISRDIASRHRLQECIERLRGYPQWTPQLRRELEEFANRLTENERRARLLGSQLDAALADPRWRAVPALNQQHGRDA